ncbi:hypothetical protein R3P38DRAFT_3594221 [Favolaschia claudopus]|uniref:Uncharacterized protein n=1 Tax=Favolaschia claudopus TaxID=2862362 RepID=A0AAW0DL20_9AGAR
MSCVRPTSLSVTSLTSKARQPSNYTHNVGLFHRPVQQAIDSTLLYSKTALVLDGTALATLSLLTLTFLPNSMRPPTPPSLALVYETARANNCLDVNDAIHALLAPPSPRRHPAVDVIFYAAREAVPQDSFAFPRFQSRQSAMEPQEELKYSESLREPTTNIDLALLFIASDTLAQMQMARMSSARGPGQYDLLCPRWFIEASLRGTQEHTVDCS